MTRQRRTGIRHVLALAAAIWIPGLAGAVETSLSAPGASEDLTERLRASSSVIGAEGRGLDTPIELISAALSDYRTMVQILYDEGHFSPVVNIRVDGREAANLDPLNTPSQVRRIDITVRPGPVFRFGTAEIGPLAPETEIPETYAPGQPATTGAIRDAASAGVRGWRRVGYAKADVGGQRITARHAEARLNAQVELAPGRKLRFGRMSVSGDTDVQAEAIRRIAGFPTGEVYSPEKAQKVATRLRRTGTFSSVTLRERETANPDGTLDFDAEFEDQPKRRLTFGVELSSSSGLDVSATWMHRNLMGRAENLRFEAAIRNIGGDEDIDGRIGLRLNRPDRLGPDDNVFYLINLETRDRTHYDILSGTLGIGARRTFSDEAFLEAYVGVTYSDADDAFGEGRKFRYLVAPVTGEWDLRNDKTNATAGYFLRADATPFLGFSGTKSGLQAMLDGRAYWDMGTDGRLVLAGRMQLGSVVGPSINEISPDFLFFSGGAGSVRGQPFESLGVPVNGDIAGGRSFAGISAEIRGRVTDRISLVGFYDLGIVGRDAFVNSDSEEHSGAGLGLRYDLGGFGPLRVDLAYPVSGSTSDGFQFYIGIGQAF
ncbi:autotransporter secretion outer membrane protein TamA [Cribrihabitans marinus]|uniref:Autotransporter secretion outer membrane protein TamA n=1 Tax=Cribrihabitans marinus TaxID=1227549 RepID=A0A1H6SUY0_9RHOB|nr:BamA/TamA family outer membrane protein [Cribrihabitans marinus]SEI69594.1 autotransporter secretion outer membrane protein TamA [Cribrihabitans marinus]